MSGVFGCGRLDRAYRRRVRADWLEWARTGNHTWSHNAGTDALS